MNLGGLEINAVHWSRQTPALTVRGGRRGVVAGSVGAAALVVMAVFDQGASTANTHTMTSRMGKSPLSLFFITATPMDPVYQVRACP